jgi:hypothetical protein
MSDNPKYSNEDELEEFVKTQEQLNEPETVGTPIVQTNLTPNIKKNISAGNELGWQQIKLGDLPTQGLFYPENTEIIIRAAVGAEIRHWSTLDETNLSLLDDMLNYVIERCVQVKHKTERLSWKDIKEIDRFYLILAISEYTFIKGENKLQVKVSDSKKVDVTKEMINYITFDERLMKFYDSELRLFNITLTDGTSIKTNLPSVGTTNWLKNYVNRKTQAQEGIDEDFISFAPFVIQDWRGLNDDTYNLESQNSNNWSLLQLSGLTHFKEIFMDTVNPVVKYRDEEGAERQVPLNFQGGVKSLFIIPDPFR